MMENGNESNKEQQKRTRMWIKLIVLVVLLHSVRSQTEFTCPAGTISGNQKIKFKIF